MFRIAKSFIILFLMVCLFSLFVYGDALGSSVKLRTNIPMEPVSLDTANITGTIDAYIAQQVYQTLLAFDCTSGSPYAVVPLLAKSYEVSKDGKMITFNLHEGVQFHHGFGELTSEDVAFTLLRHLDPKVASWGRTHFSDMEKVETPDKYTVKIYLKTPSAISLIGTIAWPEVGSITSKKALLKLGERTAMMPIGTGPYYFDRREAGQKVVLKKFGNYWRTPAKIDEIEFWVIPQEIVALGALEKGDLDLASVTQLGSYERAKAIKGTYIAEAKGGGGRLYQLYFNFKKKPIDDLRVRRALAHALDIKGISSRIGPLVKPFPSPFAPIVFAATDEFWRYEYDIDKAKKLLTEAGYPKGFELKLIYTKGELYEPVAMEVKNSWDKIVNVKIEAIERAIYRKKLNEYTHDVAHWGLSRALPLLFADAATTGSVRNYSQYSNPKVDEVIIKAKTAKTDEESKKYWREFQRMVTEDLVLISVANGKTIAVMKNNVKGVVLQWMPGLMDLEKAYIE